MAHLSATELRPRRQALSTPLRAAAAAKPKPHFPRYWEVVAWPFPLARTIGAHNRVY